MTVETTTRIRSISYETSECARCGGEGRINAYGHVYGGQCFGCNGSGRVLTSKGRAASKKAHAWKAEHTAVAVTDLAVNDRIYVTNMRSQRVAVTVTRVGLSERADRLVDGVWVPSLEVETVDAHGHHSSRGHEQDTTATYERVLTQDDLQALAAHLARNTGAIITYA